MNEHELNKKLAEWAGLHHNKPTGGFWWDVEGNLIFDFHDLNEKGFTQSLDVCFKWLVPKLGPLGYDLEIRNDLELLGWSVCLSSTKSECSIASPMEYCQLEGIALALCLAIERLVDSEVEK